MPKAASAAACLLELGECNDRPLPAEGAVSSGVGECNDSLLPAEAVWANAMTAFFRRSRCGRGERQPSSAEGGVGEVRDSLLPPKAVWARSNDSLLPAEPVLGGSND